MDKVCLNKYYSVVANISENDKLKGNENLQRRRHYVTQAHIETGAFKAITVLLDAEPLWVF